MPVSKKFRGHIIEERFPIGHQFIDLSEKRFGQLNVQSLLGFVNKIGFGAIWLCKCECGRQKMMTTGLLNYGMGLNCGRGSSHGFQSEYRSWLGMIDRCGNSENNNFHNYGGRGIKVCHEWERSFLAFFQHAGPRPKAGLSIDRIDNNGDYCHGNVRWATAKQQVLNSRIPRFVEVDGKKLSLADWGKLFGVSRERVRQLVNKYGDEAAIHRLAHRHGVVIAN